MGPFPWHHLPMPVRPVFTTITLLLHTPLIIIGAADVAFNRLVLVSMMPRYELRALDFLSHFHYLHYIILLYTTIQLPARSHTTYVLHFLDTFNSSTSHVIFLSTISSEAPLFLHRTLYHTTGFEFGLQQLCTCNMMQLSYGFGAQRRGPIPERPVNRVLVNADLVRRFRTLDGEMQVPTFHIGLFCEHLFFCIFSLVPMVIPVFGTRLPSSGIFSSQGHIFEHSTREKRGGDALLRQKCSQVGSPSRQRRRPSTTLVFGLSSNCLCEQTINRGLESE
jgi:hypothetical protein